MIIKTYKKYTPSVTEVLKQTLGSRQLKIIREISESKGLYNLCKAADDEIWRRSKGFSSNASEDVSIEELFRRDSINLQTIAELHEYAINCNNTIFALATQDYMLSPSFGEAGKAMAENLFRTLIGVKGRIDSEIGLSLLVNLYGDLSDGYGAWIEEYAFRRYAKSF